MRARDLIFHLNCFCCALCKIPLNSGDTAALQDGQLFCGEHVEELGQVAMHDQEPLSTQSFYCASPQKGRPRKRKCSPHTPSDIGLTLTHPSLLLLDQSMATTPGGASEVGTELRLGETERLILIKISFNEARLVMLSVDLEDTFDLLMMCLLGKYLLLMVVPLKRRAIVFMLGW